MKHIPELLALQNLLDEKIRKEKGIVGDTTQKKIIAFKVEFGEFLNELQSFKFWKTDTTPKEGTLEEYVDGLHFILSIGLERKYSKFVQVALIMEQELPDSVLDVAEDIFNNRIASAGQWLQLLEHYLILGYKIGLTDKQIYEAYVNKNKVNHVRQVTGY
jgi:dimeric dUTPase (all-alpha-NTP-PPase superfamily)